MGGDIDMKNWIKDVDLSFLLGVALGILIGSTGLYLLLF